ncbi:MAG: hypothetical protein ABI678_16325 [Kofleriaceae bacterium]
MANRSHLYTFDRFEKGMPYKPRGLHEWNWTIPASHLILMSGRPRVYNSSLTEKPAKVAIVADREPGLSRFLRLLAALKPRDPGLAEEAEHAEAFLASEAGRGALFLLEPIEIFDMAKAAPETQCVAVVQKQVPAIAAQLDEALAKPAEKLFVKAPKWLKEIDKDWNTLGLGRWSSVLYYTLDGEA